MKLIEKIKEITDKGFDIQFKNERNTIPPTISMYIVPMERYVRGYEFIFLPSQWNEPAIIEGMDFIMEKFEGDYTLAERKEE